MFNKAFVAALILCACFFAAISARPQGLPLGAGSILSGGANPVGGLTGGLTSGGIVPPGLTSGVGSAVGGVAGGLAAPKLV